TYVVDDNAKTGTIPGNFKPALTPLLGRATGSVQVDLSGLGIGEHSIKFFPSKINGAAPTEKDEESLVFYLVDESKLTQKYVPLFEGFTASTCGPCATANSYFNPVLAQLQSAGAINVIKYQMYFPGNGDPYHIEGNTTRMLYYDEIFGWDGYWSVPTPIYNGMDNIMDWDAQYWSDITSLLKTSATEDHQKKSIMDIDFKSAEIDASGQLSLEIEITSHLQMTGNVHAVVVEKTTTGNRRTNGEREFHNVAMAFATDAIGKKTTFEADKKERFRYSISMARTNVEELFDLQVVCFVQDPESGYIFQSASTLKSGIVANENEVMGDVRVYPNPASEFVNITNLEGADVEIFDLTGRRVYANSKVEGDLEIALASFANGTYVVRLTKDGQSAHRKLMVVR
ncbi:MAG: T9SS type A sorting domain-containing protein, partial [Bacteroidales bacterium]|nr:T9SS type A sorting domain-containing protein [Bacteroidales bacterium]